MCSGYVLGGWPRGFDFEQCADAEQVHDFLTCRHMNERPWPGRRSTRSSASRRNSVARMGLIGNAARRLRPRRAVRWCR